MKKKVMPVSFTERDVNVYGEYPLSDIGVKGLEVEVKKDKETASERNIITWVLTIVLFVASIVLFSISLSGYVKWEQQKTNYENGIMIDDDGRITYCTVYGLTQTSYQKLSSAVYQSDGKSATVSGENLTAVSEKISKMKFTATDELAGTTTNSLTLNYSNGKSITLVYYEDVGIFEIDGNRYYATARNNYFDLQESVFDPILA